MAGFDFTVRCSDRERECLRALLRRAQGLARTRRLQLRYKWDAPGYYVAVDGPMTQMEALIMPRAETTRPYAEGLAGSLDRRQRKRVADRFVSEYAAGVGRMRDALGEWTDQVMGHLGGHSTPGSYQIDVGRATHLEAQTRALGDALVAYHNRRLASAELVETVHTTVGHLLRAALGPAAKDKSFVQRVRVAASTGAIDATLVEPLVAMNTLRRRAKHDGHRVRREKLDPLLSDIVSACHQLARRLR